jgi:hypothetical protein
MKQRKRVDVSDAERSEIWDRWKRGESMNAIGRVFDRGRTPTRSRSHSDLLELPHLRPVPMHIPVVESAFK